MLAVYRWLVVATKELGDQHRRRFGRYRVGHLHRVGLERAERGTYHVHQGKRRNGKERQNMATGEEELTLVTATTHCTDQTDPEPDVVPASARVGCASRIGKRPVPEDKSIKRSDWRRGRDAAGGTFKARIRTHGTRGSHVWSIFELTE
jgi:hypothetical protein